MIWWKLLIFQCFLCRDTWERPLAHPRQGLLITLATRRSSSMAMMSPLPIHSPTVVTIRACLPLALQPSATQTPICPLSTWLSMPQIPHSTCLKMPAIPGSIPMVLTCTESILTMPPILTWPSTCNSILLLILDSTTRGTSTGLRMVLVDRYKNMVSPFLFSGIEWLIRLLLFNCWWEFVIMPPPSVTGGGVLFSSTPTSFQLW